MDCPHCGTDNQQGSKFCNECGTPLPLHCQACQTENRPGSKFCNGCGTPLTGQTPTPSPTQEERHASVESPSTEPHTPEAERRQLTILFTDLVESTALSGQMDAEDYREIVRAYQAACAEVIERFDCHLAQTLGDGLLIYSGYPVAHENDADRAVRVGLGIVEAMGDLNSNLEKDRDIRLAVRVGIHTGPVVVGEVGAGERQEQLALGEAPNVAARIQGLADPDTVVISEATYRLIQGYFDFETLGERDLRGVAEPITVYRILGDSGIQSRLDAASTRGLTPLVGRDAETALLFERWAQAKDRQGQVVLLSGEAGIGKSRLVQALKDYVAAEAHTRLECRSSPYFTNSALYPIIDMIQHTLDWQQGDTADYKLEKLKHNLSQYRLPLEATVPLFAALLSLPVPEDRYPPLNLTPQRQRQKTLETILAVVMELSERQPLLFILEDLHWTDPTTLEFLDLLINQTPTASTGVILTCRPEFQPSWTHRSYLTEITVNRLSSTQVKQLVVRLTGGHDLPAEVLQQIVERSDGVALFVEEMTKSVLESGVLKEVNGQYELSGSLSSLSIPVTLQDSLMARLDRLVTAKAVAQYAAVIGRQFSYELLHAVSQVDEDTLHKELRRLVEAELLYQRGLPPQATYTFKHALIQDAAYQSLLRSTRQQYHAKIATVLETQFPEAAEAQPELLAHHYAEAVLIEQSVCYWQRAGEKAIERSANVEATAHLTKGLEILNTLPVTSRRAQDELRMLTTLGPAYIATTGYISPEVEDVYNRAYELCRQMGEETQRFSVLAGLRRFYHVRGDFGTAREIGEQLLTMAQDQQEPTLLLEAYWSLSGVLFHLGEFALVQQHLDQAIAIYESQRDGSQTVRHGTIPGIHCLSWLSVTLWMRGYPDQALQRSHQALTLARQHTSSFALDFVLSQTATLHQYCREWTLTHTHVESADALRSAQGNLHHQSPTFLKGWALVMEGKGEPGITVLCQWLNGPENGQMRPYALLLLAEAYGQLDQIEAGLEALGEGLALVDKIGTYCYESEMHRLKGELVLKQSSDNATEAESCCQQAITIAQNQSAKSWELRAATSLARLWQSQGKVAEAHDLLEPVYNWFTEGFDTADLIDAKMLLDELLESSS